MKDYYEILEVSRKASKDTINKVFKMHMKANHPDLFQGSEKTKAEEKSKELTEAYNILSDDNERAKYDLELKEFEATSGNNQMIETLKQENEYLKQVILQKNTIISKLTGYYEDPSNSFNGAYSDQYSYDQENDEYNSGVRYKEQSTRSKYENLSYEDLKDIQRQEQISYFKEKIKSMGPALFIIFLILAFLIYSLISSFKDFLNVLGQ